MATATDNYLVTVPRTEANVGSRISGNPGDSDNCCAMNSIVKLAGVSVGLSTLGGALAHLVMPSLSAVGAVCGFAAAVAIILWDYRSERHAARTGLPQ